MASRFGAALASRRTRLAILHSILKPRPHIRIAIHRLQFRCHIVDHVASLAERKEVVETCEEEIDSPEIRTQLAMYGRHGAAVEDGLNANIEPGRQRLARRARSA